MVIRTPDQRLRVFVSSTLNELAAERNAVRQAILNLRLSPIMFESGARAHPAQQVYQAYLKQSHIFIGIYWQRYGWVAPGMSISGLEDEYNLSESLPRLFYIKQPASNRDADLDKLLKRIERENLCCYKQFTTPDELRELTENDLALLLAEYFETVHRNVQAVDEIEQHPLTNVPVPRNPLIGREGELAVACNLLLREDVALVTLTGTGGSGKSRLGIQIALELRDHFVDGVCMVGLESIRDAELVIPTITKTLGITETIIGLSEIESLKGFLCNKQVLLLLDNFEHVLDVAPRIAELLEACPRVKIMVTSRAPLSLRAEKVLPVPPLELPPRKQMSDLQSLGQYPAIELFIQRAHGVKFDFQLTVDNAPAVVEICHRLDGLPLAIELAAARIKMLSPQALLARLEHRLEMLYGGTRDLPERQHTLYKAIDWSYSLLSEADKRLFRCLSVFNSSWTLEAADAVCNLEGEAWLDFLDGLERLMNNNLLRPPEEVNGELYMRFLGTIREFAGERLIQSGETEIINERYAAYYLSLAERADIALCQSSQESWLKRLDAELDNLRAAMDLTMKQGNSETALKIATSLWRFWWTRGYWREGLQWLKAGLDSPDSIPAAMKAKALTLGGWLNRYLGDFPQAIAMLQEGLILWKTTNDYSGISLALSNLGASVMRQGDFNGAKEMLEEALDLSRQQGDRLGTYSILEILGHAASRQGEANRAIKFFNEALALAEEASDDIHITKILNDLGDEYILGGDYDQAEECFSQAVMICQRIGNRSIEAYILENRGIISMKKADFTRALDLLAETIMMWNELGDKEEAIFCLEPIAFIAKEQGDFDRAARLLGASEAQRKAIGIIRSQPNQVVYERNVEDLRNQMEETKFNAACAAGSRMTYEQAIVYAVDRFE